MSVFKGEADSCGRLLDNQIPFVVDAQARLPCLLQYRRMPITFARFCAPDYCPQYFCRCIGEAPQAAINANPHVHHVTLVEIDRALLVALKPEYLPAPLHWDEHLLGRVPMQRRSSARLGAYIGNRE